MADPAPETEPQLVTLDVPLLQRVRELQLANGLGHSDFQRYRHYCDRRLRRLRVSTGLKHGRGRAFAPCPVTPEAVSDERQLMLPLLNAERAWAFAMELKDDIMLAAESGDVNPRTKFRVARRLKKAAKWAADVKALCESVGSARTQLEADAYLGWTRGWLALEHDRFREALEAFSAASRIYSQLGSVAGSAETQDLYGGRVEDISVNVRLCQYRLGEDGVDVAALLQDSAHHQHDELLQAALGDLKQEARQQAADALSSVSFHGHDVPIASERVRLAVAEAEGAAREIAAAPGESSDAFGQLFNACDEALRGVAEAAQALAGAKAGARVDEERANLARLEGFVLSLKLRHMLQRSEALVAASQRPEDRAHLLESMRRNVAELRQIPEVEDDEDESMHLDALDARFRASRCHALAETYARERRFPEAAALAERAQQSVEVARQKLDLLEAASAADEAALEELEAAVASARCTLKARAFLASAPGPAAVAGGARRTLAERLDDFDAGAPEDRAIADFPPALRSVPVKPLFFDNAFHCLRMPEVRKSSGAASSSSGSAGSAAAPAPAPAAAGGGLFGWLRGSG